MPIETASLFFVDDNPLAGVGKLLRALSAADVLADLDVETDGPALSSETNALSGLFAGGRASVDSFVTALSTVTSKGASRMRFFYLRLAAAGALPARWRADLEAKWGDQPPAPGDLVHMHPHEFFVALDLADVEGRATAARLSAQHMSIHPHLPSALRMIDVSGDPVVARAGFELRCAPEMVGHLALVLDRVGLLAERTVLVRVLD